MDFEKNAFLADGKGGCAIPPVQWTTCLVGNSLFLPDRDFCTRYTSAGAPC